MTENNRILVIDDNPEIHMDFKNILDNGKSIHHSSVLDALTFDILGKKTPADAVHTYHLDFANQGKQGLEKAQIAISAGTPYAIAFIDIRMPPGLNGIETIKQLWKIDSEIQTVIISAYSDYDWHEIINDLGESDRLLILKKPFENIEIKQMASSLCKKWNLNRKMQTTHNELSVSQLNYIDLYDNSPTMYISVVSETGVISQCNSTTANVLGYSKSELQRKNFIDLLHNDSVDKAQQAFGYLSDTGTLENVELQIQKRNGDYINVIMSAKAEQDSAGKTIGAKICWIDITEKKKLEENKERTQIMEAVAKLAGGIAHDFNNTVAIILGNLELLEKRLEDTPHISRIETIKKSAARAAKLTSQLVAISRIKSSATETVDLNIEIKKALARLEKSIPENINMDIQYQDHLWETDIDITDFIPSFINLVQNACEAMTMGGTLAIKTQNIVFTSEYITQKTDIMPDDYVQLTIKDTGKGMTESVKKRIYEPFFTSHEFGLNKGLGLAMVFGFVRRSSGFIECDSQIDEGTEFRIHFPRTKVEN